MDLPILEWLKMARIDIKNYGEGNDVEIKVLEGSNCNINRAEWFSKGSAGYTLVTKDKHLFLELRCVGDGNLVIRLRGIDRRAQDGERLPLFVDYTRLVVNEELIFWEIKPQWHDVPYVYSKQVADGEKIKMEISWSEHAYKGEEMARLLSMWRSLLVK